MFCFRTPVFEGGSSSCRGRRVSPVVAETGQRLRFRGTGWSYRTPVRKRASRARFCPDVSVHPMHPMHPEAIRTGAGLPHRMVIQDASAKACSACTVLSGRECASDASDASGCDPMPSDPFRDAFPILATTVAYSVTQSVYNGLTYVIPP